MVTASTLCLVGGGASAVCVLDALAQSDTPPRTLLVFEPSAQPWRGRPFQIDLDAVRVNAPPTDMSIRAGDPCHFLRWLAENPREVPSELDNRYDTGGCSYVSRSRFGDYLTDAALSAIRRLTADGWEITIVPDTVVGLRMAHGTRQVITHAGASFPADDVVLCVGGSTPADSYELAGSHAFLADPYPLAEKVQRLGEARSIGVVGGGLAAVDVVLALLGTGYQGSIVLMSRSGILPGVRQRPVEYELRHFTVANLRAMVREGHSLTISGLADRMRAEWAWHGQTERPVRDEFAAMRRGDPIDRLRRNLADVDSPDLALRILQRAVPETGPDIWPYLTFHEQTQFLAGYQRAFMSLCCPMPPASADLLLGAAMSGQLTVAGGLEKLRAERGGFEAMLQNGTMRCDTIVNAVTAERRRISARSAPLVYDLVARRLGEPDRHGGLRVDRRTSRLQVGQANNPHVYAVGDLAAGSLLFTFGVPSLVDRAVDVVAALCDRSVSLDQAAPAAV